MVWETQCFVEHSFSKLVRKKWWRIVIVMIGCNPKKLLCQLQHYLFLLYFSDMLTPTWKYKKSSTLNVCKLRQDFHMSCPIKRTDGSDVLLTYWPCITIFVLIIWEASWAIRIEKFCFGEACLELSLLRHSQGSSPSYFG